MIKREPLRETAARLFDATNTVSCFLVEAERQSRDAGLDLFYSEDLDTYVTLNRALRESWYAPMPMFDPQFWPDAKDRPAAFWIEGCNQDGEVIFTHCERIYYLVDRSLAEACQTLEIFYQHPAKMAVPGETCEISAGSARHIKGRMSYNGGMWVRRDYRRSAGFHGISEIAPRLCRALALTTWQPDYTVSFVEKGLIEKNVAEGYGYQRFEDELDWRGSMYGQDYKMTLIWMDQSELIRDLVSLMRLTNIVRASPGKPLEQPVPQK